MRVPMVLTFARLVCIPLFVIVFYLPFRWAHLASAIIFALAGITDWLDGYLARRLNQATKFGAFLDPVVDKLLVAFALVLLVGNPHYLYIAVPAAIIVGREIVISALREWMAELGKRTSVAVTFVSKVKTTVQIIAIITLLAADPLSPGMLTYSGYILLYLAAILTLWTMFMYLWAARADFAIE